MTAIGLLLIVFAYFAGSVPFGLLIGRLKGVDVRTLGSKNTGATNVGRVLGRKWGIFCFALDMLKGFVPVMIAGLVLKTWGSLYLSPSMAWTWLGVCAMTVVGHVFPVWLQFKGGKGVATALGALLGIWPVITLAAMAAFLVWLIVLGISQYVSVASILASISASVYLYAFLVRVEMNPLDFVPFFIITGLLALIIIVSHRANIGRLRAGTEKRVTIHVF